MGSMLHEAVGSQSRDLPGDEILDIVKEQAGALEERGVDLFILETFSDLQELLLAIDAVRSFSRLPIVAQLTYSEEGTTHGDVRARDAALRLKEENVQVIGANCTLGPQALLPILQELVSVNDRPVSAMPNAGFPKRQGDRIVYPRSSPEYFALFAREAADLGVRLIGGCCGTTPEHIRALAEAVKSWRPSRSASPSQAAVEVAPGSARHPDDSSSDHARLQHHRPAGGDAGRLGRRRRAQHPGHHRRPAIRRRLSGNQRRV